MVGGAERRKGRERGFLLNPFRFPAASSAGYVALLLHMDGSNGSTTFVDSSSNPKTISVFGPSITTSLSMFGGACGNFSGTSNRLQTSSSEYSFPGEFCVETFIRFVSVDAGIYFFGSFVGDLSSYVYTSGNGQLAAVLLGKSFSLSAPVTTGQWYHVALTRDAASNLRFFVDGVLVSSDTNPIVLTSTGLQWAIGAYPSMSSSGGRCYLDEFRITTGAAIYTSNFSRPSAAFPNP